MNNVERNKRTSEKRFRPSLDQNALRALRIAFSVHSRPEVNTSGGPVEINWDQVDEAAKRPLSASLPKPYGA